MPRLLGGAGGCCRDSPLSELLLLRCWAHILRAGDHDRSGEVTRPKPSSQLWRKDPTAGPRDLLASLHPFPHWRRHRLAVALCGLSARV